MERTQPVLLVGTVEISLTTSSSGTEDVSGLFSKAFLTESE
jgi:hypothetical protein